MSNAGFNLIYGSFMLALLAGFLALFVPYMWWVAIASTAICLFTATAEAFAQTS